MSALRDEQLVLRIRAMNLPGTAASVCERLLEPPSQDAVAKAVMELVMYLEKSFKSGALWIHPLHSRSAAWL